MNYKRAHVCLRCIGGNLHQDNVSFCSLVLQGKLYALLDNALDMVTIFPSIRFGNGVSSGQEASKDFIFSGVYYCALSIYNFCYYCQEILIYSQLSPNGHSCKRTALLTDVFSNPCFTSQSNSLFTHSRRRTLSRRQTRTLLKMKIGFFFCLRSLVSGHLMSIIDSWQ